MLNWNYPWQSQGGTMTGSKYRQTQRDHLLPPPCMWEFIRICSHCWLVPFFTLPWKPRIWKVPKHVLLEGSALTEELLFPYNPPWENRLLQCIIFALPVPPMLYPGNRIFAARTLPGEPNAYVCRRQGVSHLCPGETETVTGTRSAGWCLWPGSEHLSGSPSAAWVREMIKETVSTFYLFSPFSLNIQKALQNPKIPASCFKLDI